MTQQGGTTATVSGNNWSYSGNTNVTNGTLQAGGVNAFSPNSTVVLSNTANSILEFAGNAQFIGGLAGGGPIGGTVNAGAAITFTGSGTNTFSGTFNSSGGITMNSVGEVQTIGGTITNAIGAITVSNGTLGYSPAADANIGGSAINVGSAGGNVGTLSIGPHALITATGAVTVGSNDATNGNGTIVQTGGSFTANGALNLGNNGGTGALNLSGGVFNVGSVSMATNGAASSASITVGAGEQMNVINGNIQMGQFFNPPSTITMNGGNLTFASDTNGTPNPSGQLLFQNNNAANMGFYTVNLNGGVFTAGGMSVVITADSQGGNFNLNRRPTVNFNGGTLRAGGDTSEFFSPSRDRQRCSCHHRGRRKSDPA